MPLPRWLFLSLFVFGVGQLACQDHHPTDANAFGLRTTDLRLRGVNLTVEVAETAESQTTGLMFRDSLASDHGMLFVFEHPHRANFWMKNTKIPLSIGFLDNAGTLLEVRDMQPFDETPVASRSEHVAYALEVNQGWFERNHIPAGARVEGLRKR